MSDRIVDKNWFAEAFDALYPIVYRHRSVEAAAPEVAFAAKQLSIKPTEQVLDLCCGAGRHMHHLSQLDVSLYGLDYSRDLLRKAQQDVGDQARLVRADMRAIPFRECFDAILNFFTSFGYFLEMEQNLAVLHGIRAALRPGGRLLMDHINIQSVRENLVPHSERTVDELRIEEHRWIDESNQRVNKNTRIIDPTGNEQLITESVRMFTSEEIRSYLAVAGLTVQAIFGDYEGHAFTDDSPRMILIATA